MIILEQDRQRVLRDIVAGPLRNSQRERLTPFPCLRMGRAFDKRRSISALSRSRQCRHRVGKRTVEAPAGWQATGALDGLLPPIRFDRVPSALQGRVLRGLKFVHTAAMNSVVLPAFSLRLCHDLMSRSVRSTTDRLLEDESDPDMRDKCLELLSESARATANKLKFFRLAFGAGGAFGTEIDTKEAQAALAGLFGPERRIELHWVVGDSTLPKGAVKLLLNVAMLAGDALVRGGTLHVAAERSDDGAIELAVRGEGPRILLDPELRQVLVEGGDQAIGPAAGAWLANALAREAEAIQLSDPSDEALMIG